MQNRERILAAAEMVYAQHGFRGATTRLIAHEAGVNEVTIFRLFGTKAALFAELRHQTLGSHGMVALPEEPVDPEQELTNWCRQTLQRMTEQRSMLRKMMSELEENPEAAVAACEGPTCAGEMLQRYVGKLRTRGALGPDADERTSISMLMSALFGDAMTRDMMPETKPQPASAAPALYVRAFLRSLGVQVAPRRKAASGTARSDTARSGTARSGTAAAAKRGALRGRAS